MQGDDKLAKMMYIFENTSPYNFLKGRNNGVKPSPRELTLLDELLIDYKLNPGVVNVLIDYVLKINNKKLTKNFVEAIASQWARLKIETVEDAMKQAKKEHKSRMKAEVTATKYVKNIKEENVPEWFDKNIQKQEINNEEEKTLQELLKEFS
jgi:replication initiation and membrane attachment protein